ncbi:PREDICTED: radial spoke head protein 3 homolog isoform X2 [Nicrophorus vespilloides]|uniref:Radial spoke head protein 3 homolog isoform X2 n=1 Tax=Nicrophorus vespilloides TaxID=110193 RepID=A0ABM1NEK6_NICVS|nr:PREDICTED: radial spoke head protein 3 homolog isoform X2 [Nicrophorus vespilloides]
MTEVSMPAPVVTEPSEPEPEDVAFKVLNNDDLPMTIIGESLLKPFGNNQKVRPNGIVYPTRRITNNSLEDNKQKPFAKSNGCLIADNSTINLKKNHSNSHGQLNNCKIRIEDLQNHGLDKNFTKSLDAKLRKLQRDEKQSVVKKNDISKPRFVTTVRKGEFLEPPPELATLLGIKLEEEPRKEEKKLYAYASHPRVLDRSPSKTGHKARCEAAAKAAATVASAVVQEDHIITKRDVNSNSVPKHLGDAPLPYANLMFERRVVRGSNFAQQPMSTGEGESAAARAAEARRRAMARKKAQTQQLRGAQLRLGSPPPVKGRRHEPVQTDKYLEELWEHPIMEDVTTQTDLFLDRPISPYYVPAKTGADVETQIYPGDLFDFDMEVQPILEVLVGKTIEQALIEVLEEEELAALREQQRRFMEKHAAELAESERLQELEKRLQYEKERRLAEYEEGMRVQKDLEERIAGAVLMQGYMADLLPSVLEGLEDEGFLTDNIKQNVDESFIPWLMKEVTSELQEMVSSRDVLTDIVREILENRAEIYRALNAEKDTSDEEGPTQDIQLIEHMKLRDEIKQGQNDNEEIAKYMDKLI